MILYLPTGTRVDAEVNLPVVAKNSFPEICAALGISRATLYRSVKEPEAPT